MPTAPSPRQLAFMRDLHAECHPGESFDSFHDRLVTEHMLTTQYASRLIDEWTTHRATLRQRRANERLSELVTGPLQSASAAAEGLSRAATSASERLSTFVGTSVGATLDGIHIIDDVAYRVGPMNRRRWERNVEHSDPSRRRFVWRLIVSGGRAHWVRQQTRNLLARFSLDTLATLDNARTFGHAFGFCVNCGRTLVVEQSIERSLGPVCYRRIVAQTERYTQHQRALAVAQAAEHVIMDAEIVDA
jgi:hypothetical protein